MKTRLIALIMTVFMVISLFAVGASAAAPNYASAANGDELYKLNFNGDDVYKPFVFRMADSKMSGTTTVVSDDGYTLTATAPAEAAKAWFYGGAINGLTIGTGKQYTITFQMSFPSGRAGFYFNFGYAKETDDPLKNNDYNGLYGFYGRLYDKNVTLSRAAGGKILNAVFLAHLLQLEQQIQLDRPDLFHLGGYCISAAYFFLIKRLINFQFHILYPHLWLVVFSP